MAAVTAGFNEDALRKAREPGLAHGERDFQSCFNEDALRSAREQFAVDAGNRAVLPSMRTRSEERVNWAIRRTAEVTLDLLQ